MFKMKRLMFDFFKDNCLKCLDYSLNFIQLFFEFQRIKFNIVRIKFAF